MPTLNWIGKEAVINHHNDVPFRILDKQYTFDNGKTTQNDSSDAARHDATENKIIHGDNLEALKALLPEYEGRIKCIYIDPPYNTGNENWVYNDNVNSPKIKKWLGQVVGKEAEDLTRHDKWLCMMYPRLKLLHKLLTDDGAIFISIDDNEQANLKLICDEIFGAKNFVAQFIWRGGRRNLAKYVSVSHEYMILYCKNLSIISELGISWKEKKKGLNDIYKQAEICIKEANSDYHKASELLKKWYKTLPEDNDSKQNEHYNCIDEKGVYFPSDISRGGGGGPKWEIINPNTGNVVQTPSRGWSYASIEDLQKDMHNNLIHFNGDGVPCKKRYLKENESQVLETVFYKDRRGSSKRLRNLFNNDVFQFPKDEEIILHFLEIFSDQSSIILDSFAGSGTTAHAVLNLNKQDGGNRKFILVEMEDYAETITAERVKRVINGYGEGKNAVEGTGGSFSYYELGEPIFHEDNNLNEKIGAEKIREYIWYTETKIPYRKIDNSYLLGSHNGTDYYFYYKENEITTLDKAFLNGITQKAEQYVIYADNCLLKDEFMQANHIIFKKIPRDIRKF